MTDATQNTPHPARTEHNAIALTAQRIGRSPLSPQAAALVGASVLLFAPGALAQEGQAPPVAGVDSNSGVNEAAQTGADGTTVDPNAQNTGTGGAGGGSILPLIIMMVGFLFLMMFFSGRAQKKEQRKRQEMLDSLRRNDRVVTNGGVIGTIAELSKEEVVLKVDQQTGTRITFSRSAIGSVLREAAGPRDTEDTFEDDDNRADAA